MAKKKVVKKKAAPTPTTTGVPKKKVVKKTPTAEGGAPKKKVKKTVKKKTAKKKVSKREQVRRAHVPGPALDESTSRYLEKTLDKIRTETGDLTCGTMRDSGRLIVGIPWPSFCLEYATANTVCPLEKYVQVYGPTGIGKSGITFEFMRWIAQLYGIGHYWEHETKFNGDWASSTIGWDLAHKMGVKACDSPEDWQKRMLDGFEQVKRIMTGTKQDPGPGRVFPYLQIVDSLMAKLLKETQAKIETQGYAGRGHPVEALSITRFLQGTAHKMRGWPFMVITVNHQNVNKTETGQVEKKRRGGSMVNFQGSFEMEINRIKTLRTAEYDGNRLVLKIEKNSYGPDKRKFVVDCVWWDEEFDKDTGGPLTDETENIGMRQKTIWDWHGATVRLLFDLDGAVATEARKLTGLVKETENKAHSKLLGVTAKSDPAKKAFHYLGAKIMRNKEMVDKLREMFGVRVRKEFQPGIEYTQQILSAKQLALREEEE